MAAFYSEGRKKMRFLTFMSHLSTAGYSTFMLHLISGGPANPLVLTSQQPSSKRLQPSRVDLRVRSFKFLTPLKRQNWMKTERNSTPRWRWWRPTRLRLTALVLTHSLTVSSVSASTLKSWYDTVSPRGITASWAIPNCDLCPSRTFQNWQIWWWLINDSDSAEIFD